MRRRTQSYFLILVLLLPSTQNSWSRAKETPSGDLPSVQEVQFLSPALHHRFERLLKPLEVCLGSSQLSAAVSSQTATTKCGGVETHVPLLTGIDLIYLFMSLQQ
jgi:hypothetical protein